MKQDFVREDVDPEQSILSQRKDPENRYEMALIVGQVLNEYRLVSRIEPRALRSFAIASNAVSQTS